MFNKFHCSILAICPIYFNDMNRRVALLVHLLLPGDEEMILMTTHLTYHSNYIDQYLRMHFHSCCFRNKLEHVPVLLAGDFNGCPEDAVYHYVIESGFRSSFKTVHSREPGVTHRLYSGEEILVDYIFYRNSTTSSVVPRQSMVLPEEYSDEEWPKDFTLSDHRMVMTEFELQTQDSNGQTGKL
ncbi:PREDICTED: uncharacterized calcium-binding protein At1g02270-like [Acropora digitifera]|uniref:uncharacterized calcium-binding protein At1g02270-like n=1 Tax=Acropora digitifera TaxID=70779 RepID=UPI00077A6E81|nr:PREDICTED: uncharacterized calcium-binding protein At1g02270-like [Acropora digitifera]